MSGEDAREAADAGAAAEVVPPSAVAEEDDEECIEILGTFPSVGGLIAPEAIRLLICAAVAKVA